MKNKLFVIMSILLVTFSCESRNHVESGSQKSETLYSEHIKDNGQKEEVSEFKSGLLDSLKNLRSNLLKLNSKVVDTNLWWDKKVITIYHDNENQIRFMDVKTYHPELGDDLNTDYKEFHFFNPDESYFLFQEFSPSSIVITEISKNESEYQVIMHYPLKEELNELYDETRASKISFWNFYIGTNLSLFDSVKYQGFGEITSIIPGIVVNSESLMLYKEMENDSEIKMFLSKGDWLSYAGVVKKDKDIDKLWIKVLELEEKKLGWIKCTLNDIRLFTD